MTTPVSNLSLTPPSDVEDLKAIYQKCLETLPPFELDTSYKHLTLYQCLEATHASGFLTLLQRYPPLQSALQAADQESTVFLAPQNSWDAHMQMLSGDAAELHDLISLHISPHYITIPEGILHMNNIPTLLRPTAGNGPQILSTQLSGHDWTVGGTRAVTKKSLLCANGLIHNISGLVAIPSSFHEVLESQSASYFLRALSLLPEVLTRARTVFAPTDEAFLNLGEEILLFLFESTNGLPVLRSLIQQHCIPDYTVFTNLIWPKNDTGDRMTSRDPWRDIIGQQTQKLPTMLTMAEESCPISLTITRCNRVIELTINNTTRVVVADLATSGGAVHMVNRILLPGSISELGINKKSFMVAFDRSKADDSYSGKIL